MSGRYPGMRPDIGARQVSVRGHFHGSQAGLITVTDIPVRAKLPDQQTMASLRAAKEAFHPWLNNVVSRLSGSKATMVAEAQFAAMADKRRLSNSLQAAHPAPQPRQAKRASIHGAMVNKPLPAAPALRNGDVLDGELPANWNRPKLAPAPAAIDPSLPPELADSFRITAQLVQSFDLEPVGTRQLPGFLRQMRTLAPFASYFADAIAVSIRAERQYTPAEQIYIEAFKREPHLRALAGLMMADSMYEDHPWRASAWASLTQSFPYEISSIRTLTFKVLEQNNRLHLSPDALHRLTDWWRGMERNGHIPVVSRMSTNPKNASAQDAGNTVKNPDDWTTGNETMTGAQASYLKTLSEEADVTFDPGLSKADASKQIDALQAETGRGKDH